LFVDGDTDELALIISATEMHSSLTRLSFARDPRRARFQGGVTTENILDLFEILPNTNINQLSLAFNRVGDVGMQLIAQYLSNTRLTSLDLESSDINAKGAKALADALQKDNTELTHINLSHNNIGGDILVQAVRANSKIEHIGDEGTALGRPESEPGLAIRSLLKGQCAMGLWGDWSRCDGSCGSEQTISRSRTLLHTPHERHGKSDCHLEVTSQSKPCKVLCLESDEKKAPLKTSEQPKTTTEQAPETPKNTNEDSAGSSWFSFFGSDSKKEKVADNQEAKKFKSMKGDDPVKTMRKVEEPKVEEEPVKVEEPKAEEEPVKVEEDPVKVEEPKIEEPMKAEEVNPVDYRSRLVRFYQEYNPGKVDSVDMMLGRFEGREEMLFNSLITKYGPEPPM
jgi:hypothetical protein